MGDGGMRRITGYFTYMREEQWSPLQVFGRWKPANFDKDDPANQAYYKHMIRFCRLGAFNEGDALNIAVAADRAEFIRKDPHWMAFAPFWVRDEARHSDAYMRILSAFGEIDDDWGKELRNYLVTKADHRNKFYEECPAFQSRWHFWAALAVDEWNTAREYAEAAKTSFRVAGDRPGEMLRLMSVDEVWHHQYALGVLIEAAKTENERGEVMAALRSVAAWAVNMRLLSPNPTDQFMFDQETIARFEPSFAWAGEECVRLCVKEWGTV